MRRLTAALLLGALAAGAQAQGNLGTFAGSKKRDGRRPRPRSTNRARSVLLDQVDAPVLRPAFDGVVGRERNQRSHAVGAQA